MSSRIAKMHREGRILVTTKLCEGMLKSTAGHEFDSTQSLEYRTTFEYNNLQDPHLKDYFYRPYKHEALISRHFITPDSKVVSRRREYYAYRRFLDDEIEKFRIGREAELKENEHKKVIPKYKRWSRYTLLDKERAEKKQQFLLKEERKVLAKRHVIETEERNEKLRLLMELARMRSERVKSELQRKSEVGQKKKKLLEKQRREAEKLKDEEIRQQRIQEHLQVIQRNAERQGEHLRQINEFEFEWVKYPPKEEEEDMESKTEIFAKNEVELSDLEKSIAASWNIDNRGQKAKSLSKSDLEWAHLLKEQADERDRKWAMTRKYNLEGWEAVKRQWDQLRIQLRLKREAWRKENERLLEIMMTEPSTSSLRKTMALSLWGTSSNKTDKGEGLDVKKGEGKDMKKEDDKNMEEEEGRNAKREEGRDVKDNNDMKEEEGKKKESIDVKREDRKDMNDEEGRDLNKEEGMRDVKNKDVIDAMEEEDKKEGHMDAKKEDDGNDVNEEESIDGKEEDCKDVEIEDGRDEDGIVEFLCGTVKEYGINEDGINDEEDIVEESIDIESEEREWC